MSVNLYTTLKSSYGDKKSRKKLSDAGYKYDSMLSNHNQQVWYHPDKKKLLYNVAGTHNLKDVGTDLWLAFGGLKNTNRYKEASKKLDEAKIKYGNDIETTVTGHSLGSTIGSYITGKNDKFYGLDGGYTIGQPTRGGENRHNYRTAGDAVSLLSENAKHMKTLQNPNRNSGILPLDILNSHNVDNIKKENIFVD
jgi:hypothetical protein